MTFQGVELGTGAYIPDDYGGVGATGNEQLLALDANTEESFHKVCVTNVFPLGAASCYVPAPDRFIPTASEKGTVRYGETSQGSGRTAEDV